MNRLIYDEYLSRWIDHICTPKPIDDDLVWAVCYALYYASNVTPFISTPKGSSPTFERIWNDIQT